MKLSEKISELRKSLGMTQEELAEICNVSRQSVSKWEADITLPEMDKLLLLGEIFHVSMDVLLKDELALNRIREVHSCGNNWFVDFKTGDKKYIVFKDNVFKYTIGNQTEKNIVCEECRKLGITDAEMNWTE